MNYSQHRLALPPDTPLHWYVISSVLGKGGFGITYLARDSNLDKPVAIKEFLPTQFATRDADKTVHPDSAEHDDLYRWGLTRFVEEARVLSRFEHPSIVRVHAVFEANNTGYMVMAYEQGRSLKSLLAERHTLPERELLPIILPVLDGLQQVHLQNFIHRDIKPDNIVVRDDGSPVLIDFGSARQTVEGNANTMTSMVSPGYAPYEQYYSKGDEQGPWTDIYSLGATLYRAITGVNPVDAVTRSRALLEGKADPLVKLQPAQFPDYGPGLLEAVNQALCFHGRQRPQSLAQWRELLETGDTVVRTSPLSVSPPVRRRSPRRKLIGFGAAFLLTGVLGALGYWQWRSDPADSIATPLADSAPAAQPSIEMADSDPLEGEVPTAQVDTPVSSPPRQTEPEPTEQSLEDQRRQARLEQEQAATEALARQEEERAAAEALARQQEALRLEQAREERALQRAEAARAEQERARQEEAQRELERRIAESELIFAERQAQSLDTYGFSEDSSPEPLSQAHTAIVQANDNRWQSSGVDIERGRRYQILAEGTWSMGPLCRSTDASGEGMYTLACWDVRGQTVAGYPHGALVGKIGQSSLAFYVGTSFEFTATQDGALYFMANDAARHFSDNSGELQVRISPLD